MKHTVITAHIIAVFVPLLSLFCFGANWAEFSNSNRVSVLTTTHVFGSMDMLAGTNGGLIHWRSRDEYTTLGTLDGLPSRVVTAICDSYDHGLAIGTDHGVLHVSTTGFRYLNAQNGLGHDMVFDVAFDVDGRLLVGTLAGLSIVDDTAAVTLDASDGLPADRIVAVLPDEDGAIWVVTRGFGVAKLADDRVLRLTTIDGLASDFVNDIAQSRTGRVIFATDGGVSVFDAGGLSSFRPPDDACSQAISCIEPTADGALCGGPAGLFELEGNAFRRVLHGDWQVTEPIRAIATDSDGTTVVALEPTGPDDTSFILRLEGESATTTFEAPSCPIAGSVSSFLSVGDQLFVGYSGFGAGLSIFDGGLWQNFDYRNSPMAYDGVSALSFGIETLWVGTLFDGLWAQSPAGLQHCAEADGLASSLVSSLCLADRGLWVGHFPIWDGYWHRGGGASFYDGVSWQAFGLGTPLEARFVNVVCEMDDRTVIFGTGYPLGTGAAVIKDGAEWDVVSEVAGTALSNILCGAIDAYGRVLLGTERSGIAVSDGDEWFLISVADGLPTNAVHSMAATSNGSLVIACNDVFSPAFAPGGICILNGLDLWCPPADVVPIDSPVTAIWIDEAADEWWFGTQTGAVFRYLPE